MTNTEQTTLVSEGQRTVVGIELPKGKPESKTRRVRLAPDEGQEWGPSGWVLATKLGSVAIGDRVSYRIVKKVKGDAEFNSFTHIAPVTTQKGSGGAEAQTPTAAPPSEGQGRGDTQGGDSDRSGQPESPAERAVPNSDTQRFEGWGFHGQCDLVALAYAELSDAVEGGELDKVTPSLLKGTTDSILNAADQAQKALVGRTDRSALSHRAAREMVRMAVDKRPLRGGLADIDAWAGDIQKTATRLLQLAASL